MSHNVELAGVEFRDLAILEKAARELAREKGVEIDFKKDGKVPIRGWRGAEGEGKRYGNTAWDKPHDHTCDAGILFPQEKYDIGLKFDAKKQSYVPFIENSWRTPFAADHGAKDVGGVERGVRTANGLAGDIGDGAAVGKLAQRYAVMMAERNAARNGLTTRRVSGKDGQLQLVVVQN